MDLTDATARPGPAPQSILLVDDNLQIRTMLSRLLAEHGRVVIAVDSVAAALAVLESGAPLTLLVCDRKLPDGDGIELARTARALRPGLAILLMSGYPVEGLGFASIRKPFEMEEFLEAVRRLGGD